MVLCNSREPNTNPRAESRVPSPTDTQKQSTIYVDHTNQGDWLQEFKYNCHEVMM